MRGIATTLAAALIWLGALPGTVVAVEPDERLDDPALEVRARDLSKELRCLVCQNQSIDDSDADLAKDLRLLVRERLVAGDTDDQVLEFVRVRYGDYVLLTPPFQASTLLLWLGPAIIGLAGVAGIALMMRRRRTAVGAAPLSPDEEARLASLLAERTQPKDRS